VREARESRGALIAREMGRAIYIAVSLRGAMHVVVVVRFARISRANKYGSLFRRLCAINAGRIYAHVAEEEPPRFAAQ